MPALDPEAIDIAREYLRKAETIVGQIPGLAEGMQRRPISSVGIVGAGTMGAGIAMCFVNAGLTVRLIDLDEHALQRGLDMMQRNFASMVNRGRIQPAQASTNMQRVSASCDFAGLVECDLVIEAAFEDMTVKESICERLGKICKAGAIIATNTSTLNVDVLAVASGRPADFLGMHFFSPAHAMRLLEVVRGAKTAMEVLATVLDVAQKIGKVSDVSGVCYGFIGNRMLESYLREAEFLLMEGATPTSIDQAIEATGMAMGPCKMIDMAGVDVAARVVLALQKAGSAPDDPAYRAVVRRLFELERFGQKTQRGYYRYEGRLAYLDPEVESLCLGLAKYHGIPRRDFISSDEIIERCLFPLINEGAQIVEEGIAYRASDVDLVWVNGYGFPPSRGGPLYMADQIGPANIVERLKAYAVARGNAYDYWSVCDLLSNAAVLHEHQTRIQH
ncbi:MAG: 3-hydroxyacyl-CoA dehydrogenase NAD-binding domain-containing protein [Sideroxyarcus sp.]|nr:3-hydroxyacyl-CoA dehydrogenase NAD-binding domain-containing protein [Sideroxyarcus sp.]